MPTAISVQPTITKHNRHKVNRDRIKYAEQVTCEQCDNKPYCQVLCAPMAIMVRSVEIEPSKERTKQIDYRQYSKMPISNSTTENIFLLYFIDRKSPKEIAKQLYKSTTYIYKAIAQAKAIIINNVRNNVRK